MRITLFFWLASFSLLPHGTLGAIHDGRKLGETPFRLPGAGNLSQLSEESYTTLEHPAYPQHAVRIKKTDFCDPTVNVYTGYLDISYDARHLFFYFFESRNDPETDDVIMWINGGPGCSSSLGLLMELGPCRIDMSESSSKGNGTLWNPYSWTSRANVFFLDQPVGVGFSYADYGETIETTEDAAKDVQAFISLFFETFTSYRGRAFHLSGESYGGRYLPVFAAEIYDQNAVAIQEGRTPINLKSVIIGNGVTDFAAHLTSRYDIGCGTASLSEPLLDVTTCVRSKLAIPRCEEMLKRECVDRFDAIGCGAAVDFCDSELSRPFQRLGRNVYDISKPCLGSLCYLENDAIKAYLDRPEIRKLLGVESPGNYSGCSSAVGNAFYSHLDKYNTPTQYYVAALLERNIPVLIYAGTYDWQCNWKGNEKWTLALEWSGHDAFSSQSLRDWEVNGTIVGKTRSAAGLTFATIYGAGHMVPFDKPLEALTMLDRWLDGKAM